jgi:predicted dehydrogenase
MTSVAFCGSGWISAVHGLALRSVPGARVTHVASRSPEHAARRAAEVGAAVCGYGDLPAGADLVLVMTPPACHADHALAAVEAGAAVVVEKPLAATLADADRLVDAAERGAFVGYAENLLFAPVVRRAVELAPTLGPLHHLEVRAVQSRPTWGDFLTEGWGGGALFDLGVHPLAVAMALAGEPVVEVTARLEGADDIAVDEHARVQVRFRSGLEASVVASWRGGSPLWDAQAASDTGVLRMELLPSPELEHNGEPVPLPPVPRGVEPAQLHHYGYVDQLASFLADAGAGRPPLVGASLGRDVLDVVCAAYASAGRGEPVAVPFTGPRDRTPLSLWRDGH